MQIRHVSELLVPGFGSNIMLSRARCLAPEGWLHTYEMVTEHFANQNLSVVVAKCWFSEFVVWDRTFKCSVLTATWPSWPDFLLFTSINSCCAGWGCPCLFPVCGWFEWPSSRVVGFHHYEPSWRCRLWLRNCLRLRSVGCSPTHARGGTLDLLMTNVLDLVRIAVVAPISNSDHSSLSAVISVAQAVPNLCVSIQIFLKHQVNWNTVCAAI